MSGIGDIRERRRQRILGNSEERMKKLMGINEQFAAEYPTKIVKEEEIKGEVSRLIKDEKIRKVSFGNLAYNKDKTLEKLKKERKISLNLERTTPSHREENWKNSKESLNEALRWVKSSSDPLKDLKRPTLNEWSSSIGKDVNKRFEYSTRLNETEKKFEVEELDDDIAREDMMESYEAKLKCLEEFAKKIDEEENAVKQKIPAKVVLNRRVEVHKKDEVEDDDEDISATHHRTLDALETSTTLKDGMHARCMAILVAGVLSRLFITLFPEPLQNIVILFLLIELFIYSYQYLFASKRSPVPTSSPFHVIVKIIMVGLLGANEQAFERYVDWMRTINGCVVDLSIFLFSFFFLHNFLEDPHA